MTPTVASAVWMLLALFSVFTVTIYFSLRARKAAFASNLNLRAQDLLTSLGASEADFANLIYGVWRDKSATHLELLVRDSRDQELASIVFHTLSRTPAFTIELAGQAYEADALAMLRQTIILHLAAGSSQTLCTFRELLGGIFQFEASGVGTIESKPPRVHRLAPVYEFKVDGRTIGRSQHIGGWRNRGIYLILPAAIPMLVRLFILAVQRQRA